MDVSFDFTDAGEVELTINEQTFVIQKPDRKDFTDDDRKQLINIARRLNAN